MRSANTIRQHICARCLPVHLRVQERTKSYGCHHRYFSISLPPRDEQPVVSDGEKKILQSEERDEGEPLGAMSKRLAEMTNETLDSGGRTAQKALDQAGFSEELKRKLEARIQETGLRKENPAAFAQINMPV